ncbi:hypothetical protein BVC80_1827g37 [Macleaya cordata]|uniref:DUF7054 domain-containing protein n=1 Tax=Macleaya cordata TaxID=56857 RepID=A0A200QB38_MACCD|nr:hypothetical protein BVC80_1827g37 [Macleaya cordata]
MSERKIRQRIPSIRQRIRIPNPSSSFRRRTPTPRRSKPSKSIRILQRCKSEPILLNVGFVYGNETRYSKPDMVLFRPHTCTDVLTSPFTSPSSSNFEKYEKDAKVVVNVTVEGSPGPVRTLVRLGASVEETIKLVVDKYGDEGRRPQLDWDAAGTEFELHHSHFSLESIKKTEKIGEVGRRSFYLRTYSSGRSTISINNDNDHHERLLLPDHHQKLVSSYYSAPDLGIVPAAAAAALGSSNINTDHLQAASSPAPIFVFFSSFVARKISKLGRRTRRLWKVYGRAYDTAQNLVHPPHTRFVRTYTRAFGSTPRNSTVKCK